VRRFLAFALALLAAAAAAQERPNAALLIAKPELEDANFSRTVLLVTQTESGETVGVILNRPTGRKHPRTREVLYFGGPVMREVQIAVFRSADAPRAPAFHVLRDVYLSMHPRNIDALLSGDARNHRLSCTKNPGHFHRSSKLHPVIHNHLHQVRVKLPLPHRQKLYR